MSSIRMSEPASKMNDFCVSLTGIEAKEKESLKRIIERLGGRCSSDFTNHVNLLIATKSGTLKYKAAKRLNIPIVKPEWIYYIYEEKVPKSRVKPAMKDFRVKPLTGLIVATTGFLPSDLPRLKELITQLDGIYKPDMTQSTNVLICNDPSKSTPKLDAARKWKVQIETEGYLDGLIQEDKCNATQADDETNYLDSTSIFIGTGFHESLVEYLRKIVRMGGGTFMNSFDACVTHYITATDKPMPKDLEIIGDRKYDVKIVNSKWLSDCFLEKKLLSVEKYSWDPDHDVVANIVKEDIEEEILKPKTSTKVFDRMFFVIDGFSEAESRVLKSSIVQYGGKLSDFTQSGSKQTILTSQKVATEFWVEKCIQEAKIIDIQDNVMFRPTKVSLPIPQFNNVIGVTGFNEVERIWIGRVVGCLGGTYTDTFSRKNTQLLAKDRGARSAKILKAKEWGIEIVDMNWLYSCLENSPTQTDGTVQSPFNPNDLLQLDVDQRIPLQPIEDVVAEQRESMVPSLTGDPLEKLLFDEPIENKNMSDTLLSLKQIAKPIPKKRNILIEENQPVSKAGLPRSVSYEDHDSALHQKRMLGEITVKKKKLEEPKVFMFTGITMADRQMIAREVPGLGGLCLNHDRWDATCSHLIVSNPQKTEKFLAACASGAWILNMKFIKDSVAEKMFVDERKYQDIGDFSSISQYWSNYYQETGKKAFEGSRVELDVSSSKELGFQRLIVAGNGLVGPGGFVLVERSRYQPNDKECVDSTFLIEYLLSCGRKKRTDFLLK